uniref:Gustatory receptor 92a n=1 Tax=Drosophila rhopaloa TaxID=1041015 RepID=A0A6P4F5I7_DRORH
MEIIVQILHFTRLFLTIPCYLSMIYLQLFHGKEVIALANRYLRIFRRVRSLPIKNRTGFGGGRELLLILISICCQLLEFANMLGLMQWGLNLGDITYNIISLGSFSYAVFASNMIIRLSFIWYISLGVLLSELHRNISFETMHHQRKIEIFFNHLNLCQFRVSIFGLFDVSNEWFLMYLSAYINWIAFTGQYALQMGKL